MKGPIILYRCRLCRRAAPKLTRKLCAGCAKKLDATGNTTVFIETNRTIH